MECKFVRSLEELQVSLGTGEMAEEDKGSLCHHEDYASGHQHPCESYKDQTGVVATCNPSGQEAETAKSPCKLASQTSQNWNEVDSARDLLSISKVEGDQGRLSTVGLWHLHAGMSECIHTYTHVDAYTHANTCLHTK